jgi:transposase
MLTGTQELNVSDFDPANIKLTERQAEVITYMEQEYFLSGMLPTVDKIAEIFGNSKSTIKKWLESPEFDFILRSKGVIRSTPTGVLTAPQMMMVNMLLNIADKRSDREKCELAGITLQQLSAWRKDPTFIAYLQKRAEAMFKDSDDIAYMNVIKNMQGGDLSASKFYFEMTGKYQPSVRHDVNIDMVAVRLIEILQVHVKDPDVLEAIASDFEALLAPTKTATSINDLPSIDATASITPTITLNNSIGEGI